MSKANTNGFSAFKNWFAKIPTTAYKSSLDLLATFYDNWFLLESKPQKTTQVVFYYITYF